MHTADSATEDGSETAPRRRTVLAALSALTGATAIGSGTAMAQQDGGRVETRGCGDEDLTPEDWSTGAMTVRACEGSGGEVTLDVTGNVATERYVQDPRLLPSSETLFVSAGQRGTLWFTGRIVGLSCSSSALNIGIAHRG